MRGSSHSDPYNRLTAVLASFHSRVETQARRKQEEPAQVIAANAAERLRDVDEKATSMRSN